MNNRDQRRVSLLLTAGGIGERMAEQEPKQFINIDGQPIIVHTLKALKRYQKFDEIVVTLPANFLERGVNLLNSFIPEMQITCVEGGASRGASVKKGLEAFSNISGLVLIHDAVRPFLDSEMIKRVINACNEGKGVVPAVEFKDSVRKTLDTGSVAVDRSNFRAVQTPQAFLLSELLSAYENAPDQEFTDDASLFESAGGEIILVAGSNLNFKITNPHDLHLAEILLSN